MFNNAEKPKTDSQLWEEHFIEMYNYNINFRESIAKRNREIDMLNIRRIKRSNRIIRNKHLRRLHRTT